VADVKAVTSAQMRELDQRTIASGVPGEVLMERAGKEVARCVTEMFSRQGSRAVLLLAGKGNNGGDAFVAARHLAGCGCPVTLALMCRRSDVQGDALTHWQRMLPGTQVLELPSVGDLETAVADTKTEVIVDGLLGTGIRGDVREPYLSAIQFINRTGLPVVAIDVPSGLDSDTGTICGACVVATVTVTMGLPKIGLIKPQAGAVAGKVRVADIGIPAALVDEAPSDVELITAGDVARLMPKRRWDSHKGDWGHLLILAGSEGYTGAPVLCAHAAARSGAGLVTLAVPREIYPIVATTCPLEVMPRPLDDVKSLMASLEKFSAVAIGPGLGLSDEAAGLVSRVLEACRMPLVLDADALSVLADRRRDWGRSHRPRIVTPHPGEMGRLLGVATDKVQANRWESAVTCARQLDATVVLKGAGTVIAEPSGRIFVNLTGTPGMARGGMGDALTGLIGGLLAQGLKLTDASQAGVFVHGLAGEIAAQRVGTSAMLVTDLIDCLGEAFLRIEAAR
jgi:hydroxyethylthiazole kinase-like uncharacterized protein yjeF